ncbi:MAG: chemotaxis response regulator protein-glutamate methylesterase [Armatimonadetes bacterium]|nr:chemotaxis response regulator protein-glutamate methylesterase [Armatimonadota bacterium]
MKKQRILIIDDSSFIRRMLKDWVEHEPDLEIVGIARNGKEGIAMAKELKPDVCTLDVEMPVMTGLEALPHLVEMGMKVLMVSSITMEGAEATMQALEIGAYDFVTKPQGGASLKFVQVKNEVLDKIRAAHYAKVSRKPVRVVHVKAPSSKTDKVVVMASSTGGPKTLATLWESLPKDFPAPILIVQHMPAGFTSSFASRLDRIGTVPCVEAKDGDLIVPGKAYVAPGGLHMEVGADGKLHLVEGPTEHGVKPAADRLFNTAAKKWGDRCIGVVMTGMGRDGAAGALTVRKAGGTTLGEAEESCVIYGMPKAAKEVGGIEAEFKLEEMGAAIVGALSGRMKRAS